MERLGVCLSCHREIPDGRFIYRVISKLGDTLGMIPENDAEHMKLIARGMFIAANFEIFGPIVAVFLIVLIVYLVRRKRTI
jgi:hypothetical protein